MLAFTFPGQGSQQPGMGRPWLDHPSWELVTAVADATGRDVAHLLLDADADELRRTENAQLATYVLSLVTHDAVSRLGVRSAMAAGHSLGEYSALTALGALSIRAGARLVAERGAAMQAAADARAGAMAAVLGADEDTVADACAEIGDVWVANANGGGQVVIAGAPDAVDAAGVAAKERGARKVMALPVGGAFHTPFMAPAADRLRAALRVVRWSVPSAPVLANVDAQPHSGADDWAELLDAQLTSPVRWGEIMERMMTDGTTVLVELGPGRVLTGVAKRTAPDATAVSVSEPDDLDSAVAAARDCGAIASDDEREGDDSTMQGGEHLFASERLVVSPAAGIFEPTAVAAGHTIAAGAVVGTVAGQEIRSPFPGRLMGVLAVAGERLTRSQPVAWLRTA